MLEEARATLTDEVIELHERMLNSLFSKAKRTQAERLQQTGKLIQSKLRQYINVGQALSDARDSGGDPWLAIENILPWPEFVASLEETRHLARKIILTRCILLPRNTAHYGNMPRACCQLYS